MDLLRFLWQAARAPWREPLFAVAFVVTLGLGIGANTAIFSVVNGVLLRELPYPEAHRIVYLEQKASKRGMANINFSFPEIADYRDQVGSLDEIVEFGDWTFNVLERGEPHRATAGLVTANFFDVLGMRAALGRTLQPEDRVEGAEPVVVLTYEYWQRVFEGDPDVLGQALNLTSKVATIVGVLEPGAHYASSSSRQDFYANYATNNHYSSATMEDDRKHRMTDVFARLAPSATYAQAEADLNRALHVLRAEYPDDYPAALGLEIEVTPWKERLVGGARTTLLLLLGAAFFVLVIACANVGNLTLARALRREKEMAVRSAMGAGTGRLRAQLFVESLTLALIGAGAGLLLAQALLGALRAYTARFTHRTGEIAIDGGVLGFTLFVAVAAAVALSLVPGLVPAKRLAGALSAGASRATAGGLRRFLQRALVVSQLAVSFVLLVGAGLLVRTLWNLHAIDPGYDLDQVLSIEAPAFGALPGSGRTFSEGAVREIGILPSVEAVALTQTAPLAEGQRMPVDIQVEGVNVDPQESSIPAVFETVTPDYFTALGIEMVHGRAFTDADDAESHLVAILNHAAASHYFGEDDPVGRRISYFFPGGFQFNEEPLTIIGVAADARVTSIERSGEHLIYLPEAQTFPAQTVLVRTAGDPRPITPQVIEKLRAIDPNRPLEHIYTLAEVRNESLAPQRLNATLFALFAALAVLIAAVGVAAVLMFAVQARRRELGIRAAVGASPGRLLALILRDSGLMALVGLALGVAGALALTRFLQQLLYDVEPLDAVTFAAVGLLLLGVALIAALLPGRMASKTAPAEVLTSE